MLKRKQKILKISTKNRGLPAKSFIHVLSIDYYLKIALSCLSNTNFLNLYIMGLLKWKVRYKDRKQTAEDFLDFLSVYNETRVDCLFPPCKFFNRSEAIILINKINNSILSYKEILEKPIKNITIEDIKYMFMFKTKLESSFYCVYLTIPNIIKEVTKIQNKFMSYYISYIIQGLMKRRKGVKDPTTLKTDAYDTFISMLNSYNTYRSKVPFSSYLKFFIKAEKNKIIKEEERYIREGVVLTDNIEKEEQSNSIDWIQKTIHQSKESKYKKTIERLIDQLPPTIFGLLAVKFGLIEPLKPSEEIVLLMGKG